MQRPQYNCCNISINNPLQCSAVQHNYHSPDNTQFCTALYVKTGIRIIGHYTLGKIQVTEHCRTASTQDGLGHERNVMSVRLSVKRGNCDKTKETRVPIFLYRGVYPPNSHDATLPPRLPPLRSFFLPFPSLSRGMTPGKILGITDARRRVSEHFWT